VILETTIDITNHNYILTLYRGEGNEAANTGCNGWMDDEGDGYMVSTKNLIK
jgi:hypothetical protein